MFGASTSAGRPVRAMTLAIVYVLPEPVTPSSVWNDEAVVEAFDQLLDRLRLVARGLERLVQLVGAAGIRDDGHGVAGDRRRSNRVLLLPNDGNRSCMPRVRRDALRRRAAPAPNCSAASRA